MFGGAGCGNINTGSYVITPNQWYDITGVYVGGGTSYIYVNGVQRASGGFGLCNYAVNLQVGSDGNSGYFSGSIANVQTYNTSLSANEITALYQEGIGGAPIDLQNLVGWWPLNGNANDYSGNGNNGQATGVTYTGSWTGGYTPP
jgi:hypothetical protein